MPCSNTLLYTDHVSTGVICRQRGNGGERARQESVVRCIQLLFTCVSFPAMCRKLASRRWPVSATRRSSSSKALQSLTVVFLPQRHCFSTGFKSNICKVMPRPPNEPFRRPWRFWFCHLLFVLPRSVGKSYIVLMISKNIGVIIGVSEFFCS